MADSTTPPSTTAELLYLIPPANGARAYQHINLDPITGEWKKNFGREDKEVILENLRGKEDSVKLDTAGFQYYKQPAKHTSFANDEEVVQEYYPESVELIKKLTGASRVVVFDHSKLGVNRVEIGSYLTNLVLSHSSPPPGSNW